MKFYNMSSKHKQSEVAAFDVLDSRSFITSKYTVDFYEKNATFPISIYVASDKAVLRIVEALTTLSQKQWDSVYSSDGVSTCAQAGNKLPPDFGMSHSWTKNDTASAAETQMTAKAFKIYKMLRALVVFPLCATLSSLSAVLWLLQWALDVNMVLFVQLPIFLAQRFCAMLLHWVLPVLYFFKNTLCYFQMKLSRVNAGNMEDEDQ